MKELYTNITLRNGEVKEIKVELEDELADWLVTQPEEVYRDFLVFEYKSKCVERKETRRTQSLNASLSNGFDVVDEEADVHIAFLRKLTCEQVHKAIMQLEPQQQWLIEEIYFNNRTQSDIAAELDVKPQAITNRLKKIFEKMKRNLKKGG
jgi:DNA-directed RNA polymerase specialized sigma24 family protein